jgi:hypothetical protein
MAIMAEYAPGARFGLTEATTEVGVVPRPLNVSQVSPLFWTETAVTATPEGLLNTEIPWLAGSVAPCCQVKLNEVGETVICARTFRVTETEALAPELATTFTAPV